MRRFARSKFVLVAGPRQVGKTTLARSWLTELGGGRYFNWDVAEDRAAMLSRDFAGAVYPGPLALGEIHKYPRWSQVPTLAARFENMVACHLLKSVHYWNDLGRGDFDLRYARDREKREVDFVVTDGERPVALIECKLSDEAPAQALVRFQDALGGVPAIQLVRTAGVDRRVPGSRVRVVSASTYLAGLL